MLCRLCFVLTLGTVLSLVGTAAAQQAQQASSDGPGFTGGYPPAAQSPPQDPPKQSWWQRFKRDYHRNACWPEPWIAGDRAAVNVPFQIMADNAWQRQNLLSDYHFVEGTTELNNAGLYRLKMVITQAPAQHRAIFVGRLMSDKATTERVLAVQKAIIRIAPDWPPLPVYESNLGPGDWQGEAADAVIRNLSKTQPDPRLPTGTRAAIN